MICLIDVAITCMVLKLCLETEFSIPCISDFIYSSHFMTLCLKSTLKFVSLFNAQNKILRHKSTLTYVQSTAAVCRKPLIPVVKEDGEFIVAAVHSTRRLSSVAMLLTRRRTRVQRKVSQWSPNLTLCQRMLNRDVPSARLLC